MWSQLSSKREMRPQVGKGWDPGSAAPYCLPLAERVNLSSLAAFKSGTVSAFPWVDVKASVPGPQQVLP